MRFCLVDYGKYQKEPWKTPMFENLKMTNNCAQQSKVDKGEVVTAGLFTIAVRFGSLPRVPTSLLDRAVSGIGP